MTSPFAGSRSGPSRATRPVIMSGIGIEEADQRTIFQIFRRLHGPEDYGGGAGIGLAFSRKIVERHGGRLWVQSVPGEGSAFYFTLAAGGRE